jgi:hypothetical protein
MKSMALGKKEHLIKKTLAETFKEKINLSFLKYKAPIRKLSKMNKLSLKA